MVELYRTNGKYTDCTVKQKKNNNVDKGFYIYEEYENGKNPKLINRIENFEEAKRLCEQRQDVVGR